MIFPTSITGAYTYAKAGQVDRTAAWWMAPTGLVGAVLGALATAVDRPDAPAVGHRRAARLAVRSGSSAARAPRGDDPDAPARAVSRGVFAVIGFVAGVVSGLLGIGGGLVMVPLLAGLVRPAA